MQVIELHLHVSQQVGLFREELVADRAAEQLEPDVRHRVRMRCQVLQVSDLVAVTLAADRAPIAVSLQSS